MCAVGRPASGPARAQRAPLWLHRAMRQERAKSAPASQCAEQGVALLAHELRDVPAAKPALPGRSRALPSAKGLEAGPGARRRSARAVGIEHAGLDRVEEESEFLLVLRV